jgi:hypothetical protein
VSDNKSIQPTAVRHFHSRISGMSSPYWQMYRRVGQTVRMGRGRLQLHEIDHVHDANFQLRQVLTRRSSSGESTIFCVVAFLSISGLPAA